MKAWITTYALSKTGILEVETETPTSEHSTVLTYLNEDGFRLYSVGEGKNWHRTREAAVERAEVMRLSRIKSLRKQLIKIEGMKFK